MMLVHTLKQKEKLGIKKSIEYIIYVKLYYIIYHFDSGESMEENN